MEKSRLQERPSTSVNVTVGRPSRDYLTEREVERLIEAAKQNRSGHRDATAILVAYRHGLKASEVVALRWDDIDGALACAQGQGRRCQRASDIGSRKSSTAQLLREASARCSEPWI
jgi:site-specific recombinase XerD